MSGVLNYNGKFNIPPCMEVGWGGEDLQGNDIMMDFPIGASDLNRFTYVIEY